MSLRAGFSTPVWYEGSRASLERVERVELVLLLTRRVPDLAAAEGPQITPSGTRGPGVPVRLRRSTRSFPDLRELRLVYLQGPPD